MLVRVLDFFLPDIVLMKIINIQLIASISITAISTTEPNTNVTEAWIKSLSDYPVDDLLSLDIHKILQYNSLRISLKALLEI